MIVSLLFLCGVSLAFGQKYEGCFRTSAADPELPSPALGHPSAPADCIRKCRSLYYMFAGLMNGQQCYCVSKFGKNGPSNSCDIVCVNDPANYCGSREAMSVYFTGQQGPSPPRRIRATRNGTDAGTLAVTWEPPDIPNGNVTSYTLRAVAVETHASDALPPVENRVQGGASNATTLRGLQPGTKYNVSVTAGNTRGLSDATYAVAWTAIGPPDKPTAPVVLERDGNALTVLLTEGRSERGPISAYQVVIVQAGAIPPVGADVEYSGYKNALDQGLNCYVTAQLDPSDFHRYHRFVVGDGRLIGGYYNAPLQDRFVSARVGLAVVSRVQTEVQRAYSDLAAPDNRDATDRTDPTALVLCVAIAILGLLLTASVLLYFVLRRRHERFHMRKLPEQQELTLQGPVYEVDNVGYIPDDVPERANHYRELERKVRSIPRHSLTVDNFLLRRGRFGTVHAGTVVSNDDEPRPVTVHAIADGALKGSEKRHMLRQLDVCIRAGTMRYLAALVGTCETPDTLYIVCELPPQILKNRLLAARSDDYTFPVDRLLSIASSVAAALRHLAGRNIVHAHLCARSVGLCDDWTPKLMGHGIARYGLEDIKYTRWTAVECLDDRNRQQPSVIWAFGVLLWEMLSMGGTPYSNLTLDSEVEDAVARGVRLSQLSDIPDPIYEVMSSCWRDDPEERPTFDELARLDTLSVCPIAAITEPYIPELELN